MLGALPALAYHFRLMPWDLDLLTMAEVESFLKALDDIQKESAAQSKR